MAFKLLNLLTPMVAFIVAVVKAIKGKAKFTDVVLPLFTKLTEAVMSAIDFKKLETADQLEMALAEIDLRLGEEEGAAELWRDLPPDKEEELTDAMLRIIEIVGKCKLKVPGYYVEE